MNAVTEQLALGEGLPPEPPAVDSPAWRALLAVRYADPSLAGVSAPTAASAHGTVAHADDALLDALYRPLCSVALHEGFAIAHVVGSSIVVGIIAYEQVWVGVLHHVSLQDLLKDRRRYLTSAACAARELS